LRNKLYNEWPKMLIREEIISTQNVTKTTEEINKFYSGMSQDQMGKQTKNV